MYSQVSLFPNMFSTVTLCTNFSSVKQWEKKCTWQSTLHEAAEAFAASPASESQMGCPNLPFFRIPLLVQASLTLPEPAILLSPTIVLLLINPHGLIYICDLPNNCFDILS